MSAPQQPYQQQPPSGPGQAGPPPGYGAPQWAAGQAPQQHGQQQGGQQYGQQYGQQGGQQGGGLPNGELVLNLQKPFGAMGMISPVVKIDGYPAQCGWGRNAFPVPAGGHRVDVAQSYLWTYGPAAMEVVVEPGRPSEVYYAGPMFTFGVGGSIGTQPQKRRGMGVFIGILVVVAVIILLAILAVIIGNS